MDTQDNLATIPPQDMAVMVAVEPPSPVAEKDPLLALLESAVADQEEYVKAKLQSSPPSKQLRPGKVEECKLHILNITPQAPSGIRIAELYRAKKDANKDEMDQAIYEMTKMAILGTISAFTYRMKVR